MSTNVKETNGIGAHQAEPHDEHQYLNLIRQIIEKGKFIRKFYF